MCSVVLKGITRCSKFCGDAELVAVSILRFTKGDDNTPGETVMAMHRVETIATANKDETLEKKDKQEAARELLPGIPNVISVDIIAAKFLRWSEICILSTVSPGWCQAVRSREVYNARVRSQSTEKLVLYCGVHLPYTTEVSLRPFEGNYCYRLPLIPGLSRMPHFGSLLAPLDGKIYAVGGGDRKVERGEKESIEFLNKVHVLDLGGQKQWKRCASMHQARGAFGSAVMDGKIYVFGGYQYIYPNNGGKIEEPVCGSEVYDPQKNTWTRIKSIPNSRFCHHIVQAGPSLVLHGGYTFCEKVSTSSGSKHLISKATSREAYHPGKDDWRVVSNEVLSRGRITTMGDPLVNLEIEMHSGISREHIGPVLHIDCQLYLSV